MGRPRAASLAALPSQLTRDNSGIKVYCKKSVQRERDNFLPAFSKLLAINVSSFYKDNRVSGGPTGRFWTTCQEQ